MPFRIKHVCKKCTLFLADRLYTETAKKGKSYIFNVFKLAHSNINLFCVGLNEHLF